MPGCPVIKTTRSTSSLSFASSSSSSRPLPSGSIRSSSRTSEGWDSRILLAFARVSAVRTSWPCSRNISDALATKSGSSSTNNTLAISSPFRFLRSSRLYESTRISPRILWASGFPNVTVGQQPRRAGIVRHEECIGYHGGNRRTSGALRRKSPTKVQHVAKIDKEGFAAAVVHDMRAPLNACLMSLSLIELKASQPAEVLKSVEVLRRNLERQAVLIDDLNDALQIVGGGLELEPEAVDLVDVADTAARKTAAAAAVQVDWAEGRPGPCPVTADPERLARAIG